jgi:hypothetical protein
MVMAFSSFIGTASIAGSTPPCRSRRERLSNPPDFPGDRRFA